jgi:hypothetical protein
MPAPKWTDVELQFARIYADWVRSGQMSYYRAMAALQERCPARSAEACRSQLKQLVAATARRGAAALRSEAGSEAVEWLAVAGLIVGAALIAYTANILVGLNDATYLLRLTLIGLFS